MPWLEPEGVNVFEPVGGGGVQVTLGSLCMPDFLAPSSPLHLTLPDSPAYVCPAAI